MSIRGYRPSNSFTTSAGAAPCVSAEHLQHLQRAQVDPLYRGPVFTTETIYVPCGGCGTPVDPVARVPVGRMFFHPHCLKCAICAKLCSRTLPFAARQGQPVCLNCDRNKSVSFPPQRAAAFRERAQASLAGTGGTLRALMERSATRSPTRRGHMMEMQQLAISQRDPNILLISAEHQHEIDANITRAREHMEQEAAAKLQQQQQMQQLPGTQIQPREQQMMLLTGGGIVSTPQQQHSQQQQQQQVLSGRRAFRPAQPHLKSISGTRR